MHFFIESLIFSGSKLILQLTDEQFQGQVRHLHLLCHDKWRRHNWSWFKVLNLHFKAFNCKFKYMTRRNISHHWAEKPKSTSQRERERQNFRSGQINNPVHWKTTEEGQSVWGIIYIVKKNTKNNNHHHRRQNYHWQNLQSKEDFMNLNTENLQQGANHWLHCIKISVDRWNQHEHGWENIEY